MNKLFNCMYIFLSILYFSLITSNFVYAEDVPKDSEVYHVCQDALKGNADAQTALGEAYRLGKGVSKRAC